MAIMIIKDVIDRVDKKLMDNYSSTKRDLLILWEKYYVNLAEDARLETFKQLKTEYFRIADEYEKKLESNPSMAKDELLYKKYTIMQRKIGIRMLAAVHDTSLEQEAKTFEAQSPGTPAGDRSATNIKFQSTSKQRRTSGPSYSYSENKPVSFSDFLKLFLSNKNVQKKLIFQLLFYLFLELLAYLIELIVLKNSAKKSIRNEYWSNLIGNIVGKDVSVNIVNSNTYSIYSYYNSIIISTKILEKLNENEIIALSLYTYGSTIGLVGHITMGIFKSILVSSSDIVLGYIQMEQYLRGTTDYQYILIYSKTISQTIIVVLINILGLKMGISNSIKYVKEKGYLNHLMTARKKLPPKRSQQIPDIDIETANATSGLLIKFMNIIGIKDNIEKDNISKPVSLLQKAVAVFKKFT